MDQCVRHGHWCASAQGDKPRAFRVRRTDAAGRCLSSSREETSKAAHSEPLFDLPFVVCWPRLPGTSTFTRKQVRNSNTETKPAPPSPAPEVLEPLAQRFPLHCEDFVNRERRLLVKAMYSWLQARRQPPPPPCVHPSTPCFVAAWRPLVAGLTTCGALVPISRARTTVRSHPNRQLRLGAVRCVRCASDQADDSSAPLDPAKPDMQTNPRYFTRPNRVSTRQRMFERNQNNVSRQRRRRALQAILCGQVIAETYDYVFTDGRYYFPPGSVNDTFLIETEETRMMNPIGRARMMDIRVGHVRIRRAAWRFFEVRRSDGGVWTTLQNYTAFWKSVRLRFAPRNNAGD